MNANLRMYFLLVLLVFTNAGIAQETDFAKAERYLEQKRYQEIITLFEGQDKTQDPQVHMLVGRAWFGLKKYELAISSFERAVSQEPNMAEYHYWVGASKIEAVNGESNFFKKGTYAFSAEGSLIKAIELDPNHEKARVRLGNYYLNAPKIAEEPWA